MTKRLQSRSEELCREGLFRASRGIEVLGGFGRVFSSEPVPLDAFEQKEKVLSVDAFVSHSWHAGRWAKYGAICFFLNLGLALKATALATAVSMLVTFLLGPQLSPAMVFVMLMDLPAAVFLVSLIFGQHLTCERWCPSLWVDKLCVDQTSDTTKQRGIAGLPTVVACTGTLLVLWDATYFERLWCNLELSVFVKCCGVKRLRFVPLWLTPWLLGTMCITYLEARLQSLALIYDPSLGTDSIVESDTSELQTSAWGWQHVLTFLAETQVFTVSYLPVIIFSIVTFHQKLDGHKLMLEHLKTYDIREAKCSVESDRPLIEGLVAELFDGLEDPVIAVPLDAGDFVTEEADQQLPEAGLSSPARLAIRSVAGLGHQDCLQFFNDYVRGPVRDAIINDLGHEEHLSWTFMPTFLFCIAYGWVAKFAYKKAGFASMEQEMVVNYIQYFIFVALAMPMVHPLLLRLMGFLTVRMEPGFGRTSVALILAFPAYSLVLTIFGFLAGVLESWAITRQPSFLVVFLVCLPVLFFLNYMIFLRSWQLSSSCRCLSRAAPYQTLL